MAQLTWRNVDAPNFSGSLDGYKTFSDLINRAGTAATGAVTAYDDSISKGVNQGIRAAMQRYQDPAAMQEALTSGAFMQGIDPRRVSMDTFNAMDKRTGDLTAQNTNLYNMSRTQDADVRMDAAAPALLRYAGSAARGDTAGMRTAQENPAFGNLQGGQLLDMFKNVGGIANTGIGIRDDTDKQAAIAVLNQVGPRLGNAQDVYPVLRDNKAYNALSPTAQRLVQQGVTGMGYQFQGPSAIGGSGSPATAAIGSAVGGGLDVKRAFGVLQGTESNNQQFDKNGNPLTSPKGATGGSQVMPETGPEAAKLAGLPWNPELFSRKKTGDVIKDKEAIEYNDSLGMAYFNKQLKDFDGNLSHAYAAYNAGPAATKDYRDGTNTSGKNPRLIKTPDGIPPFKETQDYVNKNMSEYGAVDPATALVAQARPSTSARKDGADSRNELQLRTAQDNAGGMANVFAAMEDTKPTPVSIAAKWADEKKFPGANPGAVVDLINDMVSKYGKYGVTANVAGAILENGGLTGATDWTQRLITNRFRAMGEWVPNDKYIEGQVDAIKNGKTLTNASTNQGTGTAASMLKSYLDEQATARADVISVTSAARDRPELLEKAVPRAQSRLDAADTMLRQLSKSQQGTSNLQPVLDKPQPVATTAPQQGATGSWGETNNQPQKSTASFADGLITKNRGSIFVPEVEVGPQPIASTVGGKASAAIAKSITEEPAKDSPLRTTWLRQQNEARKANEVAAKEAGRIAKLEQERLMAERAKAYLAKTGKVLLAPQ